MADEITVTAALSFLKNGRADSLQKVLQLFTMTGNDFIHRSQVIGSTEETLDKGEIGTIGWCFFFHTGKASDGTAVTDTIALRLGTGADNFPTLKAGQFALLPLSSSTTPYAIASDTNAPVLEYVMLEE